MSKTILIVEDQGFFSYSLSVNLMQEVPEVKIFEAATSAQAVELARKERPQFVLLDVHVPGATGLSLLSELTKIIPEAKIAVVSGDENPHLIRMVYDLGGQGYIPKTLARNAFVAACVKFLEQGFYFSSEHYTRGAMTRPVVTARQLEVLMLLDQGNSVKQIAAKLGLAPKTVERHTENAYRALNVSNARAACQAVRSLGLLRS